MRKIINRLRNNKPDKLLLDSFWAIAGNILNKSLAFIAGIFVARYLGSIDFGQFGILKSTALSLSSFATLGLGYTATRFVSKYKDNNSYKIEHIIKLLYILPIGLSICLSLIVIALIDPISKNIIKSSVVDNYLIYVLLSVLLNSLLTTQVGIIAGLGLFKKMAKVNGFIGVISFLITCSLSFFYGVDGAIQAFVLVSLINVIINYVIVTKEICNHHLNKTGEFSFQTRLLLSEIVRYTIPVSIQELVYASTSWGLIILLLRSSSFSEVGLYNASVQWSVVLLFIPGILRNVVLSHMSVGNLDIRGRDLILNKTLLFNFSITLFPAIAICVFSNNIDNIYGESYSGVGSVITILAFNAVFTSMSGVLSQAYLAEGKNWLLLIIRSIRDFGILLAFYMALNHTHSINSSLSLAITLLCGNATFFVAMWMMFKLIIREKINENCWNCNNP